MTPFFNLFMERPS